MFEHWHRRQQRGGKNNIMGFQYIFERECRESHAP